MKLKDTTISQMNFLGIRKIPFLFIIDFLSNDPVILPLNEVNPKNILYNFNGIHNEPEKKKTIAKQENIISKITPVSFEEYKKQFYEIQQEISQGNTYLLNLTTSSPIETESSLEDIFYLSSAKYKMWFQDKLTFFSPENFIKIHNNKIYSFPMKGTIDGTLPEAEKMILSDPKETSEHYTIVDLIRNDLNRVAEKVSVDSFRYIDRINTSLGSLLQVSSQISGELAPSWKENIGSIFAELLPAGSISGAPKEKTMEIISRAETHDRGYYTGVTGIFDGDSVDSAVMIRFIEKQGDKYYYKSGGGITYCSEAEKEYQELIQKIYVPIV